jgi:hypothetical protein
MIRTIAAVFAMLAFLAAPIAANADHEARFELGTVVEVTGVLTKLVWQSPRVFLYLDVTRADGQVENVAAMTAGTSLLRRAGLDRDQFVVGATYRMGANLEKNGGKTIFIVTLEMPDGRVIALGK